MSRYAMRILKSQPNRLLLTVGGIALCIVLMMFLLSVYSGVADGCLEYIRQNDVDLWVLHRSSNNIMRTSSVLPVSAGARIRRLAGVASASPIMLLLAVIQKGERSATVFLTGFDETSGVGGPPHLVAGRSVEDDLEIVLDVAFARKMGFAIGDNVVVQDDTLRVVGISTGTNAFVIQYAFVTLRRARQIVGVPSIATCFLVTTEEHADAAAVAGTIRGHLPMTSVYDHSTFVANNTREMQAGFLPFIYTIAAIGVVVLTVIVSLLLTITVLEQRRDFAVLKTLGAPMSFLPRLIVEQGVLLAAAGYAVALVLFFPMVTLVQRLTPEIATRVSPTQIALVAVAVAILSVVSSLISLRRLRRIYPLEAFS
jgi:putative ABC transport system permease protein